MTDKVQCKNTNCDSFILPTTAKKTGGFCMPCIQKREREEQRKYIEQNRIDIDHYEGVTDFVEIIKLHHIKRKDDPLIRYLPFQGSLEEVYHQLSEFDEARLVEFSIIEAEGGNLDCIESICLELAAFRSCDLSKLHTFMIQNSIYYPGIIFKDASSKITKALINKLNSEPDNRNLILLCLAWIGNEEILNVFNAWIIQPPEWSSDLYIAPYDYSRDAGWEIQHTSEMRQLFFEQCYPLLPTEDITSNKNLLSCSPSDSECKFCGNQLTNLLEIDLSNNIFDFIELEGERLKLATCEICACYTDALYMEFDTMGTTKWSDYNKIPEYLPNDADDWGKLPKYCLTLSPYKRPAFYAANEFLPTTFSQLGGMPTWIQYFSYPTCPSCGETMIFIAQISNEEIEEYGEGTYYTYICRECKISATNYQQT